MSTFTLKIDTDNAAFFENGGAEVARILRRVADDIADFALPLSCKINTQPLRDVNGNRVGGWRWDATCECGAHPVEHSDWSRHA